MKQYKITKKQYNSKMCLVCGLENKFGIQAAFYELENGELAALFTPREEHQSYPERLHGGITGAILDEVICRAIMITEPDSWGVTVELNIKYLKPAPLNQPLKAVGRVTRNSRKIFEGEGEVYTEDGTVIATATGKYLKQSLAKITAFDFVHNDWQVVLTENEPAVIDLPGETQ
ncbi:MAG TPA: PaaI family thioesterase [Bacillota bacterium]|nr:PaaI family thioesterase [Bacillota bacterium]